MLQHMCCSISMLDVRENQIPLNYEVLKAVNGDGEVLCKVVFS